MKWGVQAMVNKLLIAAILLFSCVVSSYAVEGDRILVPGSTEQTTVGTLSQGTWNADVIEVPYGGSGVSAHTEFSLLMGSGTSPVVSLPIASDGQIPIGSSGASPVIANISGTTDQVNVTNGSGTITLSTPQDIDTGADVTFEGLTLSGLTASRLMASDGSKELVSTSSYEWIAGTTNQIDITDDGDGTATLLFDSPTYLASPANIALGNYTEFEIDGSLEFIGDATVWEDLRFPLSGQRLDSSSGRIDFNYFNGGVDYQSNARYPDEPVSMLAQLSHGTKFDEIRPHMHWLQISSDVPNWLLAYKVIENSETTTKETDFSNHTLLTIQSHAFTYVSGNLVQISSFGAIDISSLGISDCIHFVLFRDSSNTSGEFSGADPSSSVEFVYEFDVHYEIDTIGSRSEFTK